jgi:hypothetical protein
LNDVEWEEVEVKAEVEEGVGDVVLMMMMLVEMRYVEKERQILSFRP